ncbi:MAG: SPOR domain-containing protein [Planctomycetota bacterium]
MPRRRRRSARGVSTLAATALLAVAGGCTSTTTTETLDDALEDYYAGRYDECHDTAVEIMLSADGESEDQAAYLAGLSALRMGDLDEAELRLRMAADAEDEQVAAKARASLGLVRLEQGHPEEAAELLTAAASGLSGEDATEAARLAASARTGGGSAWSGSGGRPAAAATSFHGGAGASGRFTLQAGAFREQARAESVAREVRQRSPEMRPVQVIPRRDARGRTLYLVQLGRFATRQEAAVARTAMNRPSYIVAPVAAP